MKDYFKFWKHYFNFKGHSTISEFLNALLWLVITNFAVIIGLGIVLIACFDFDADTALKWIEMIRSFLGVAALPPTFAITSRRLRDAGYSPKSFFWLLVPVIGMIAFAARLFSKSVVRVDGN